MKAKAQITLPLEIRETEKYIILSVNLPNRKVVLQLADDYSASLSE